MFLCTLPFAVVCIGLGAGLAATNPTNSTGQNIGLHIMSAAGLSFLSWLLLAVFCLVRPLFRNPTERAIASVNRYADRKAREAYRAAHPQPEVSVGVGFFIGS